MMLQVIPICVVPIHTQLRVVAAHSPKYFEFSVMGATLHHHAWVKSCYPQSGCTNATVNMNLITCNFSPMEEVNHLEHFPRKEIHI